MSDLGKIPAKTTRLITESQSKQSTKQDMQHFEHDNNDTTETRDKDKNAETGNVRDDERDYSKKQVDENQWINQRETSGNK